MKLTSCLAFLFLLRCSVVSAQQPTQRVFFSDIDNFWVAYDSIRTTPDSLKQLQYLKKLYVGKGTAGLKSMMEVRRYTAEAYVGAGFLSTGPGLR
jgi:hypothetical protein